jgi:hypothetical protein
MLLAAAMKRIFVIVLLLAACHGEDGQQQDAAVTDAAIGDASGCAAPNVWRYPDPGCDQKPSCGSATMDLCLRLRCSCTGKVIGGCDFYGEPWTLESVPVGAHAGDSCLTD